jgi:pyruvate,water dikinase
MEPAMPEYVFFSDPDPTPALHAVGGKAFTLIELTRAGYPVPPGFVLTTAFFEPWLAQLRAAPEWGLAHAPSGEGLEEPAARLGEICQGLAFTSAQQEALDRALGAFRRDHFGDLFAVRSSAPEEDLEGASFAGGYESRLGVPLADVAGAVQACFASAFDPRVFIYKRERGLANTETRMAVIVQAQIAAESAGVAFSLNPLNNCYDEALITANFGLGESVVAGEAEPDTLVVDRVGRRVLETRAGAKNVVTRLDPRGGTRRDETGGRAEPSLLPAQALEIVDLLDRLEKHFAMPVDIEWAFAAEKLHLLQARPITAYLPLPEEMLTEPGAPRMLYANSTLIEQGLQGPLSVLGTEFLGLLLGQVGGAVGQNMVGPGGITFAAGGGYYMNLTYAIKLGLGAAILAPGSVGDAQVTAILDRIDKTQYLAAELPARVKSARGKMALSVLPLIQSVVLAYLNPRGTLRRYLAALPAAEQRFERVPSGGRSLKSQAVDLAGLMPFFYSDYGIPMVLAGHLAQRRIQALFRREAEQARDPLVHLGVSLPGNKTAEMGERMLALALTQEIQKSLSGERFVADLRAGRFSAEFVRRWEEFVAAFGMRCPGEIDPATPRPRENPTALFEQIKALSGRPPDFFAAARSKREAAYAALRALALKKGKRQARALEKLYEIWVTLGGYRETPKHYAVMAVDEFRRRALAVGQAFTAAGRLERAEQIFDLTFADIDQGQADPALDLRALACRRALPIEKMRRFRLPARVIDSRGKIYFPPAPAGGDGALIGVPISPGVVQGRVKVLAHAAEKPLLPGEILVARATDPGWTPLFINAAGIVLEIGGALQHGAVVAREYGIPCVSGVDGAASILRDGQLVEVDGSNGLVRVLE